MSGGIGDWRPGEIYPIQVTNKAGFLAKLFVGLSDDNYELNMLVFKND